MKKNKKIFYGVLVFLLIIFSFLLYRGSKYKNHKLLKTEESLIEKQAEIEKGFKTEGYTFEKPNVILNPYGDSPLTALILFETKEEVAPEIKVVGKTKNTTFKMKFKKAKKHYLSVYGLYENRENEVILKVDEKENKLKIKTDKLKDAAKVKKLKNNLGKYEDNQLYFFSASGKTKTAAYDVNGDIRWYLDRMGMWDIGRAKNGRLILSTNRILNPPYFNTGLVEMDLLGKVYKEYTLKGGYHHDYFEMENGNFLVASNNFESGSGTVEDVIVELDRKSGKIIKEFDLKDVLNQDDGKSYAWTEYDWFHNNSVWYDKKTNSITLSGRHKDAVINIDYDSGKLNWIIGDKTNWDKKYHKYFFKPIGDNFEWQWSQHAAMITPEGYLFILDNGNNKSKIKENYVPASKSYTRGVIYEINTKDMTIKQLWQYGKERGSEFYSPYISDVDYLGKDHYIVHSGGISKKDGKVLNVPAGLGGADELLSDTVEIKDNKVLFEIILETNNYRVEKMPLYLEKDIFKLGEAKEYGKLAKTKVDKTSINLFKKTYRPDKEYEKREIKFHKEKDRLVMEGKFNKEDKVEVVLYNNLKFKHYNVRVSRRPYTALCVDIGLEELKVKKYIHDQGLNGEYSIYLKINDKLYDTDYKYKV